MGNGPKRGSVKKTGQAEDIRGLDFWDLPPCDCEKNTGKLLGTAALCGLVAGAVVQGLIMSWFVSKTIFFVDLGLIVWIGGGLFLIANKLSR